MVTPDSALPNLEVDAHLLWGASLRGKAVEPSKLEMTKEELGIDFSGTVGKLSMGMRERVALATALLVSPSAILVDEAFANLHEKREVHRLIQEAGGRGEGRRESLHPGRLGWQARRPPLPDGAGEGD